MPRILRVLAIGAALAAVRCGGKSSSDAGPIATDGGSQTGSAKVTWNIVSPKGDAVSCAQVNIASFRVTLIGQPMVVPCGQTQEAEFTNLLPDRYAVTVELLTADMAAVDDQITNVVVTAGQEIATNLTFTRDPLLGQEGGLQIRWRIDSDPASTGCARIGGTAVTVQDMPGSIASFEVSQPCSVGTASVAMLQAGDYGVLLTLSDATGMRLATASIGRVTVMPGMTAMPAEVPFLTGTVQTARIHATWNVNTASSAAAGCQHAGADGIVIAAFPLGQEVATFSTSVACDLGQLRLGSIPPGPMPQRILFQLYQDFFTTPPIPMLLTSTTVMSDQTGQPFFFVRGETTTVSVDLKTMSH
jgi:hypothetical protein